MRRREVVGEGRRREVAELAEEEDAGVLQAFGPLGSALDVAAEGANGVKAAGALTAAWNRGGGRAHLRREIGPKFGAHTGRDRTRRLRGVSRRRGGAIAPLGRGSGATGRRGRSGAEERRGAEPVEAAARVYGGAWGGVGSRAAARGIKRQGEAGIAAGRSGIRIPANSPVIAGVCCVEGEEKELTGGPRRSATEGAVAG